jgi:hypothetical protein
VPPSPCTLDSFDRFNFFNFEISRCTGPVQTIQPLAIPQVFGIRLALVASTSAMSDFANSVIGGLAFSAACGGLIIGASLIVLAFVPPGSKGNR